MKKLIIPIIVFIGIGINAFSTEKSGKELKGDKYYFVYSFDKAIDSYTHVKLLSLEGQRRLAQSYHNLDQDTQAEIIYSKLVSSAGMILPEDYYNYAMILKSNGKYEESNKWMDKFSTEKPDDLRAKSYAANRIVLSNMLSDEGKYKIRHLDMNTDAEDFAPSYYNNKIVFASSRSKAKMIKRDYNWNGKPFLNMYVSEINNDQMNTPKIFDKKLDGKLHDGPASFSKAGTYMAFTRNHYKDKNPDKIVELQICFSNYKDGKWSKPEPFIFNNADYSVGQPCLSADGNKMYFTSDMPGGFGGSDLYSSIKNEKGEWEKPENLGSKINTEGNEMFPFLEEKNNVLFFTSNGHFGLGGLDIFICAVDGNKFGNVINAGAPLNTQYDDFAMIVDDKLNKGYFSSNRTGGSGDDDIYSVELLKGLDIGKRIKGIAKDNFALAVAKTFVTLLDDRGKILDTLTTQEDGTYTFLVQADKNFKLIGKKENYLQGENTANTFGKEFTVNADVILLQKKEVVAEKEVITDPGNPVEMKTIYFDLDKYNIRPDAELELDKIVSAMNKNPTMKIELGSYTDSRASAEYNQILSDKREKASSDYIKKRITKPERISGKGYGETHLVNNCSGEGNVISTCSEDEHQLNRRTEFTIVKK